MVHGKPQRASTTLNRRSYLFLYSLIHLLNLLSFIRYLFVFTVATQSLEREELKLAQQIRNPDFLQLKIKVSSDWRTLIKILPSGEISVFPRSPDTFFQSFFSCSRIIRFVKWRYRFLHVVLHSVFHFLHHFWKLFTKVNMLCWVSGNVVQSHR